MSVANDVVQVLRGRDALTAFEIAVARGHDLDLDLVREALGEMADRGLVCESVTPAYALIPALDIADTLGGDGPRLARC